jgi:hypothetical protein
MPYKLFVAGTEGLASDVNTYLMNQSVMTFADATARNAALPTPTEGMCVFLTTPDHFQIYNNTNGWVTFDTKWNAYTPTYSNVTVSTSTAYYYRTGKVTHFYDISTSVLRHSVEVRYTLGASTFFGKGIFASSGTVCQLVATNVAGTYASSTSTSATVPGAWVAGNAFLVTGSYEAL